MSAPSNYKQFHTFYSPNEWAVVCERANSVQKPVGKFIKDISINGDIKLYNLRDVIDLTVAINRIGVNINQIAHMDNQSRNVFQSDIERLQADVAKLSKIIDDYIRPLEYTLIK